MASLQGLPTVRISQRASSSCAECARRKTRCDKQVPCGNCVKRNKAHLCHIVPHVRPKDAERLQYIASSAGTPFLAPSAPLSPAAPPVTPAGGSSSADPRLAHASPASVDALALSAFAEVEALRSGIDGLRSRLTGLESVLIAAFGRLREDDARCASVGAALQGQGGATYGEGHGASAHAGNAVGLSFPDGAGPPFLHPHAPQAGDIFVHPSSSASLAPFALSASSANSAYHPLPPPHPYPPPFHPHAHHSRPSSGGSSASPSFGLGGSAASTSTTAFTLPPLADAGTGESVGGAQFAYMPFEESAPEAATAGAAAGVAAEEVARERDDELREEEVAASLSLEFMALGRTRALSGPQSSAQDAQASLYVTEAASLHPSSSVFDPATLPHHPSALFPTSASLARVLPPFADTQLIIEHALEHTGWHHACIHAPTFRAELAEFWRAPAETRFDAASPAWLALLFAQLACGVRHMTREQLGKLGPFGLSDDDMRTLSKTHLDASLACLYRSHFLANHQLHAIQAIAILVVTCQDGAFSNLFPMLLSTGICLAQDLGLHCLPSEEAWLASVAGQSLEARAKSLIAYETRKRVFWCLTSQDWFSIPYRRTTAVQPTQVTTPLPSNAHDEDLMTGVLTNRPPSEYTVVSRLLVWIQVARILQQAFQHVDENPSPSYESILELDAQLQQLLNAVPAWFTSSSAHSERLPPNAAWMRSTFIISSSHKVLTLHRAFFRRFEPSRRRALDASRTILREAARAGDSRMWTVPYHISAAASVVCLDLFQRGSPVPTLVEERSEVLSALGTLRRMSSFSAIAARGAALIENLLAEEHKLPPLPLPTSPPHAPTAKRRRTSDAGGSDARPPTSAASLANLLASPEARFLPPSAGHSASPSTRPGAADVFFAPPPGLTSEPSDGLGLSHAQEGDLPASFMSAFLESGFDPLEGTIVAGAGAGEGAVLG